MDNFDYSNSTSLCPLFLAPDLMSIHITQCSNFLSLSTRGSELKVNESFNKGESKLEPYSKQQLPYFQSLQLQQQRQHGLMPVQSSPYASTFLDQLPVAGPQVFNLLDPYQSYIKELQNLGSSFRKIA